MKKFCLIFCFLLLASCSPKEEDFKSTIPETKPGFEEPDPPAKAPEEINKEAIQADQNKANLVDVEEKLQEEANVAKKVNVEPDSGSIQIPAEINLFAPFFSQAPEGDWSEPWQNACEEASLILAHYGMKGETLRKEEFKKMVLDMVDWENQHFGFYQSTTIDEVVRMYQEFFIDAFQIKVIDDPTVEDIKQELAQGHLIVAPFAGRMLGNPFYSDEGPYYHMMVLKGYDQTHFITNDVGTRRGENFIYPYQTILDAMHDYIETSGIEKQPAKIIVLLGK